MSPLTLLDGASTTCWAPSRPQHVVDAPSGVMRYDVTGSDSSKSQFLQSICI